MNRKINNSDVAKMLIKNRPIKCEHCNGKLFYEGAGEYRCHDCGGITLDDYGKVKQFLEEFGPQPYVAVSEATGVDKEVIMALLKDGKVAFEEGAEYALSCERCGCTLRSGRYCPECYQELTQGLKNAFKWGMGEKIQGRQQEKDGRYLNPEMAGKMRYL